MHNDILALVRGLLPN